jgi:hypothetical protein
MTNKQTDTVAMTEQQLDTVAGGAPHYQDFNGRPRLTARASKQQPTEQNKRPIWKRER